MRVSKKTRLKFLAGRGDMPVNRYYINTFPTEGDVVTVTDAEAHHLIHVTRHQEGDQVELVNGEGDLYEARLVRLGKKEAELRVLSHSHEPQRKRSVVLYQAIPRLNRLDFIVEKGTELGMTEFVLFPGKRSERAHLSPSQIQRYISVGIAAMKQCGRLHLPLFTVVKGIQDWERFKIPTFFGDLSEEAPLLMDEVDGTKKACAFVVGPEGGFTAEEEVRLKELGAKGVKLHGNVLRTDTASLVALSLLTHAESGENAKSVRS